MEFSGDIQFADEGSWLTLITESDDPVTVTVTVKLGGAGSSMSFSVTPNSGLTRLPAGELVRALTDGGTALASCAFTATQGDSSCTYRSDVLPCREFDHSSSLAATVFTTRPSRSPVYDGEPDQLYVFKSVSGGVSAYARFTYDSGEVSEDFQINPVYIQAWRCYGLDVACGAMMSTAEAGGLDTSRISSYDVWFVCGEETSKTYTFEVTRSRLPLKTYLFVGRRGTREYIHATGKFSRSIESETRVFVNSGGESELDNDSSLSFEQNSGHVGSAGMGRYWLDFLSSKKRWIVEGGGTEREIIVDEYRTSLSDMSSGSLTFKWHYADRTAESAG